jgi:hypothetical protein
MISLFFAKNNILIRERGDKQIFDPIRKKWLLLSPEEWVRQNILHYLLGQLQYPASLIAVEKEVKLGELRKRCDIVIYNPPSQPWMIIECKEMKVNLNNHVIDQVLRYHISLPATYLVITNGAYTYGFVKKGNDFVEIDKFPDFVR